MLKMLRELLILKAYTSIHLIQCRLKGEGLKLELPKFNLKFKMNSFTYSLFKLRNSLPSQVRLSSDTNDFKSKLHYYSF